MQNAKAEGVDLLFWFSTLTPSVSTPFQHLPLKGERGLSIYGQVQGVCYRGVMKPRHFDIDRKTLRRARSLRKNMTEEERLLWSDLKGFRKFDLAFRKQAPIGPFIVDFLCRKAMLIVEVDGEHHGDNQQWTHDRERDAWLVEHGYRILRFWNADIRHSLDDVTEAIFVEAKRLKDLKD